MNHSTTYTKTLSTEREAQDWKDMKNRTSVNEMFATIEGPENNYMVVDLRTAIEHGQGYNF